MAWTAPATAIAGSVLTAAFWNAQVKSNMLVLKTSISDDGVDWSGNVKAGNSNTIGWTDGFWARVSANVAKFWNGSAIGTIQAYLAETFLTFTDVTTGNASTSKHGFLPKLSGSASDALLGDGTFGALSSKITLLKSGSGTLAGGSSAQNVDTYAMASQLTALDTLVVFCRIREAGNGGAATSSLLYNSTDSISLGANELANENAYQGIHFISCAPNSSTKVIDTTLANSAVADTKVTFTTNWTGAWTLALRSGAVNATDTLWWSWSVYKIAGQ